MSKFNNLTKNIRANATTMGEFIKRYRLIYLSILLLIAAFEVGMMVYMSIRLSKKFSTYAVIYLVSYVTLFLASVITAIIVFRAKKKNTSPIKLSVLMHLYIVVIVIWATTVSSLDVTKGNYPIVFLTIIMVIGAIVFIDPIIYGVSVAISTGVIFTVAELSETSGSMGYYFNISVFIIMAAVVAYRNYRVSLAEEKHKRHFQKLSEFDALTGLKNENSYYKLVDELREQINAGEEVRFTISLMDVNLLKATNDKFGHQYGAHLIKTAGHAIGKIFIDSYVFHVGGDEFVVVSVDDYDKVEEYIKKFDEELYYKHITFKGNDIILSVARGYATYNRGDQYSDVLERADKAMYDYKKEMKQQLHIAER